MIMSAEQVKKPEYGLFGLSNTGGIEILNANKITAEPLSKMEGLNRYTVPGVDGRGKDGAVSVVDGCNLHEQLSHVGEILRVTSKTAFLKAVSFPSIDNQTEKYLMVFDTRRREANGQVKPLKIFKQTLVDTGKKGADGKPLFNIDNTVLLNSEKIVIKKATLSREDISSALKLAVMLLKNNAQMSEGFKSELKQENPDFKTLAGIAKFLEIFDNYFKRSDENLLMVLKIKKDKKLKFANSEAFEESVGSITKAFAFENFDTIEIGTLSDARDVLNMIKGDFDPETLERIENPKTTEDYIIKTRSEFFKEKGMDFYLTIKNKGTESVGYDNTGNIVLLENYALQTRSNGDVYSKDSGGMAEALRESREAFGVIDTKASKFIEDGNKPSDDEVLRAVSYLIGRAKAIKEEYFGEDFNMDLPENISMVVDKINGHNESESQAALYTMKQLHSLVTKYDVKNFLANFDTSSKDFLTKDKKRIRGVPFSVNETERVADELFGNISTVAYEVTQLNAKLPVLTFPVEGNIINFKEVTAPVVNVYTSKETGNVLSMKPASSIESWFKGAGRLGLILDNIVKINPKESSAKADLNSLMNFGFNKNNFGLLGIQRTNEKIKDRLGSHLNKIYNILKEEGLEAGQKYIKELSSSENPTSATLGRYVESVSRHADRNRGLRSVRYALNNKENENIVRKIVNGESKDIPEAFDAKRVYNIKMASVIVENALNTINMVQSVDKEANVITEESTLERSMKKLKSDSVIENTAKSIGYAVSATTNSKLVYGFRDTNASTEAEIVKKYAPDNSIHAYPTGVNLNPFIVSNKWNEDKKMLVAEINLPKIKEVADQSSTISISSEIEAIKAEYAKNRPTYTKSSAEEKAAKRIIENNANLQDDSDIVYDISSLIGEAKDESEVKTSVNVNAKEEAQKAQSVSIISDSKTAQEEVKEEVEVKDTTADILEEIEEFGDMSMAEINQAIDDEEMELYSDEECDIVDFYEDFDNGENIGTEAKKLEKSKISLNKNLFR